MTFFKYRHKYAWGTGSWLYVECNFGDMPEQDQLDEVGHELLNEHDGGEKYRGVDVEIVERPPREWLEKTVEVMKRTIEHRQATIERYEKMLAEPDSSV